MRLTYPVARTVDQTDDYHGTLVPDPYRWLEDVDSPETLEWIQKRNALTFSLLEKIPQREALKKRLTELWDFSKAWAPYKVSPAEGMPRHSRSTSGNHIKQAIRRLKKRQGR